MPRFIAVVGIDGSGKDTQVNKIVEFIRSGDKYANVWVTREPSKMTDPGRKAIATLTSGDPIPVDAEAIELAKKFIFDRREHCKFIRKIKEHSDVVCCRYDLCTYAYQIAQAPFIDPAEAFGILMGYHYYEENGPVKKEMAKSFSLSRTMVPDITFLIDVDVDVALERIRFRGEEKELFEKKEFLCKVKKNYLDFANAFITTTNRLIIIIDGNQSVDEVTAQITAYL